MTVFTNVPDDVLEPGDPIRSVDILAIKENTNYNHQNTVLEILQEDIFTTSGTWTKASGYDADDTIIMILIAGGGSGAATFVTTGNGSASGGGSGGVNILVGKYSQVSSGIIFIIGAGGAAVTRSTAGATSGNVGGQTHLRNSSNTLNAKTALPSSQAFAEVSTSFDATGFFNTGNVIINTGFYVDKPTGKNIVPPEKTYMDAFGRAFTTSANTVNLISPFQNLTQFGGGAARKGATNRPFYNDFLNPALFTSGGLGSGTANGQDATGIGAGGGGCCRQSATAVSGAGGSGGLIVQYYRGRVSAEQVFGAFGA